MDKHISLSPCPFCGMGLTLDIDEEGGVAILHSLKGEKNCWFPSIVEIEMPVETTLEEMVEILNRRPIEGALNARIAELEAERRWIPVGERLPERDGFYLVLENVNQVAGYYHWCKVFGWNTDGGRTNIQSVTHWMPLPEPPEVKDE